MSETIKQQLDREAMTEPALEEQIKHTPQIQVIVRAYVDDNEILFEEEADSITKAEESLGRLEHFLEHYKEPLSE
jgi:hypothetical protein